MSQAAFSRLVDEFLATSDMTLGQAISAASAISAKHVDSFQRARQDAIDKGYKFL